MIVGRAALVGHKVPGDFCNDAALDQFCKTLTVLTREQVAPKINPNDFISEVEIEYEKQIGDYLAQ